MHRSGPKTMRENVRSSRSVTDRKTFPLLNAARAAALLAALPLADCTASDDSAARFLVAPDQYVLFNCPQLLEAAQVNATRQRELEALMAKADVDSSGRAVSAMSYRPEYLQLRGRMTEMRKEAATKHCRFTPGIDMPTDRKSDAAVR